MKRVLLLTSLVLFASLVTNGQANKDRDTKRDTKVAEELRGLIQVWDKALVNNDVATMDRLLAVEFAFVGGANKVAYLTSLKPNPDTAVESAVSTQIEVQVYGDTAVLTGLDTINGNSKGVPFMAKWLYMDVWLKRSGRWQCVKTFATEAR